MAKENNMLDSDEVEVQENTLVVSGIGKVGRVFSMSMDDAPYITASHPVEPVDVYPSLCSRIRRKIQENRYIIRAVGK